MYQNVMDQEHCMKQYDGNYICGVRLKNSLLWGAAECHRQ